MGVNAVDLSIFEFPPPAGAPFVGRSFRDSGLRWSGSLRSIVLDPGNSFENLGESLGSSLGIIGNEYGGFRGQGHDGILELEFCGPRAMHPGGEHHEGSSNDRHDDHGEELLPDTVGGFAVEFLDLEYNLFVPVMVLNGPAPEVEVDDFLFGKFGFIEEIGEKHRDGSIGADQPDHSQLNTHDSFPLPGGKPLDVFVGRGNRNVVLLPTAAHKCLDGWERGLGRAAEQKVALFVVFPQVRNELVARISSIEEQHGPGRDGWQERPSLLALGPMDTDHTPGHGKAPEHIVGCCNQALGIVPPAFMLEATMRIELLSDLIRCRKVIFGTIKGDHRHPMPKMGGVARLEAIGQLDGLLQNVLEDGPGNLLAGSRESATVYVPGVRPESAASGSFEELARLDIHSLALPGRYQGENEGNEFGKGKFPGASEVLG